MKISSPLLAAIGLGLRGLATAFSSGASHTPGVSGRYSRIYRRITRRRQVSFLKAETSLRSPRPMAAKD
ncbi:MAG: hypothetical protein V4726_12030 [Verrucomicrobiota bacterium]